MGAALTDDGAYAYARAKAIRVERLPAAPFDVAIDGPLVVVRADADKLTEHALVCRGIAGCELMRLFGACTEAEAKRFGLLLELKYPLLLAVPAV